MSEINNREDTIDSRSVIERIEELETEIYNLGDMSTGDKSEDERAKLEEEAGEELTNLRELDKTGRDTFGEAEWESGVTLIADDHFEDYARELAEDIGAINDEATWPNTHIDWEAAAEALRMDYTSVEFSSKYYDDVQTYWGRA